MIVRRIALLFALLLGFLATQLPEFVEQYRQRLGGAIDELSATVARFDGDSAEHGLTRGGGLARLAGAGDAFVRQRGLRMSEDIARLAALRQTQDRFRSDGQVARLETFFVRLDPKLARGTLQDFEPAVPVTGEAAILGLIGFMIGGSVVHVAGRPLARRRRQTRQTTTWA